MPKSRQNYSREDTQRTETISFLHTIFLDCIKSLSNIYLIITTSVSWYLCPLKAQKYIFYASSVTPHIWPWFPNSCLYLILEVFDIDLCSMECYFPRSRARKVTFRALERGEWLSMLWDLGFCKCQHSQFTYSLLIKRNLQVFERALPEVGIKPMIFQLLDGRSSLLG